MAHHFASLRLWVLVVGSSLLHGWSHDIYVQSLSELGVMTIPKNSLFIKKKKVCERALYATTHNQEWQRVGFGQGFFIPGPNPWGKTRGPDPPRLGYRVFSRGPDPPQPGPAWPAGPVQRLGPICGPTKNCEKELLRGKRERNKQIWI